MSTLSTRMRATSAHQTLDLGLQSLVRRLQPKRATLIGLIFLGALLAFEAFNYGTTEFALGDLLGNLSFAGMHWATILALAFCGIDFAGVARLFTPEPGIRQPAEMWYLLGAWFLAATMNATLTWWAVSLALIEHQGLGNEILGRQALLNGVPVFVALLVWLIRVLMIGSFTMAGDRLLPGRDLPPAPRQPAPPAHRRQPVGRAPSSVQPAASFTPAPKPGNAPTTLQASSSSYRAGCS
jgi:hypothetical protein